MRESTITLWALQVPTTWNPDGTVRLGCPGLVAAARREMVPNALEKTAETLHELMLPLGQLLSLALEGPSFAHQGGERLDERIDHCGWAPCLSDRLRDFTLLV